MGDFIKHLLFKLISVSIIIIVLIYLLFIYSWGKKPFEKYISLDNIFYPFQTTFLPNGNFLVEVILNQNHKEINYVHSKEIKKFIEYDSNKKKLNTSSLDFLEEFWPFGNFTFDAEGHLWSYSQSHKKIFNVNLEKQEVIQSIPLKNTHISKDIIQKLTLDSTHQYLYIPSTPVISSFELFDGYGEAYIFIVNIKTGETKKVLTNHETFIPVKRKLENSAGVLSYRNNIEKDPDPFSAGLMSLSVDPMGQWLYYVNPNAGKLYRIPTKKLMDFSLNDTQLASSIEAVSDIPMSFDILAHFNGNIFIGDAINGGIGVASKNKPYKLLKNELSILPIPGNLLIRNNILYFSTSTMGFAYSNISQISNYSNIYQYPIKNIPIE